MRGFALAQLGFEHKTALRGIVLPRLQTLFDFYPLRVLHAQLHSLRTPALRALHKYAGLARYGLQRRQGHRPRKRGDSTSV